MKQSWKIPFDIDFIDGDGCHLMVNVTFNDEISGKLVIDTGASKTVFDKTLLTEIITPIENEDFMKMISGESIIEDMSPEQLAELEQGDNKMMSATIGDGPVDFDFGMIKNLSIGELTLKNFPAALVNLDNVNKLYENIGKEKIWGLLGSDILNTYQAIVNYQTRELILHPPENKEE